jgi:hypothetical protein
VLVFSSLLFCSFGIFVSLFFFYAEGQSAQGAMLVYPMGSWGNTT